MSESWRGCEIIYEDNHLLITVKPPNLLTQGDATGDDCLLDRMKAYIKEKYQKPGEVYLGMVHRLDRPVGGLVAFALVGKPLWITGLAMGAAQIAGAWVGSKLAMRVGARLIKPLLVTTSTLLALKLLYDLF